MASEKTRGAPKRQGKKPKAAAIAKAAKKAAARSAAQTPASTAELTGAGRPAPSRPRGGHRPLAELVALVRVQYALAHPDADAA